jgi:hypothetical protein
MADIILAEFGGQAWLVRGEQYIDDLLANTLPAEIRIEVLACRSRAEVDLLWAQDAAALSASGVPWLIHPRVVDRARGRPAGVSVLFAQWSAMLDEHAHAAIKAAAISATENADIGLVLTRFIGPESGPMLTSLAELRTDLIAAELVKLGISADRIGRETCDIAAVPGMGEESQRVDIGLRAP